MGHVRAYQPADLDALHAINSASTPGVSHETREGLEKIIQMSVCDVFVNADGMVQGFLTLIEPGTLAYTSPNLRWFEDWQARENVSLIYVDRIALAPTARGQGLGRFLYTGTALKYGQRDFMVAEINTKPDNPGSHRFHQRFGFERVGEQNFEPYDKAVAYYALRLGGRGNPA